jgi:hypothetical protein
MEFILGMFLTAIIIVLLMIWFTLTEFLKSPAWVDGTAWLARKCKELDNWRPW